jgi:hypothetical protein
MMWLYKLRAKFLTHTVLAGTANIMIFAGMILCVAGGFFFVVAPWLTWSGLVLFIGGLIVLGCSDNYLPSELERKRNG